MLYKKNEIKFTDSTIKWLDVNGFDVKTISTILAGDRWTLDRIRDNQKLDSAYEHVANQFKKNSSTGRYYLDEEAIKKYRAAIRLKMTPVPIDIKQRQDAISFYEELSKLVTTPARAINLIVSASNFRVTFSKKVYEKLEGAFSSERETGFLLFADPKTKIIVEAVDEEGKKQGRHSFGFSYAFVKQKIDEMRAKGLEFVGHYHSHTGPTGMEKYFKDYDHSLPSPDDAVLFPNTIPGSSYNDREDPQYKEIARGNRLLLLGAVKGDKFAIRAFAPLDSFIKQKSRDDNFDSGYKWTNPWVDEFKEKVVRDFYKMLKLERVKGALAKHYRKIRMIEFKADVTD